MLLPRSVVPSLPHILLMLLVVTACACRDGRKADTTGEKVTAAESDTRPQTARKPVVTLPQPPAMLQDAVSQRRYVAVHFWDSLDWNDTTLLSVPPELEQAFAAWAELTASLPHDDAMKAAARLMQLGNGHPALQEKMYQTAEKILNDAGSPLRSEEIFISISESYLADNQIDGIHAERVRLILAHALKNRWGTKASDVAFLTPEGRTMHLYDCRADYVLVYFFNPDCHDCKRVGDILRNDQMLQHLQRTGQLKLVAVYPDEDLTGWSHMEENPASWTVGRIVSDAERARYELTAIPSLYLLDNNFTVLLKDAPVEAVCGYFLR